MYITDVFKTEKQKWDGHLLLFFLNVFLVVLGYSLRGSAFQVVKIMRIATVLGSLISLFAKPGDYRYIFQGKQNWQLWLFITLNFYVLAFSFDFIQSFNRIIAWIPFLIYINYFIVNLFRRYEKNTARLKILQILNLSYVYPMVIALITRNPLQSSDIYGAEVGGFYSNVIGWAGTMIFITGIDVIANVKLSILTRRVLIGACFLAIVVIATSGSRSSYVSVAVTLLILVFQNQRMGIVTKFVVILFIVSFSYYTLQDENSAINRRIKKSETQLKKGEAREELLNAAIDILTDHPLLLFTGFGYDMSKEGIRSYKDIDYNFRLHNSYLELLVSTGGFTFLFFILFYVLNAVFSYVRFDMRKYVFLPTLIFIPALESNLNAGQFLFFPWMTFLFFYIHYRSYQVPIPATPENSLPLSETHTNETNHSIFQNRRNYT